MKKSIKTVFKILLALLAAALVCALLVFFRYLPRYHREKTRLELQPPTDTISVMSCNVRCLTPLDLGKKSWFYRADLLAANIAAASPGIIGFQEVTRWQYDYLTDCLPDYASTITYRDRSPVSEGCPVFYDTRRYTEVDKGSFWLSETPEVMSKDWNSACYRICGYVILEEAATGARFVVFNTHLDHVSDEARINGIGVVLDKIQQFGGLPAVIMGDFNAEEGSETYNSVTEDFLDAARVAGTGTNAATYQNWGAPGAGKRIDYFMISKTGITVEDYQVLSVVHDGVYATDHNPILLQMKLQ